MKVFKIIGTVIAIILVIIAVMAKSAANNASADGQQNDSQSQYGQ